MEILRDLHQRADQMLAGFVNPSNLRQFDDLRACLQYPSPRFFGRANLPACLSLLFGRVHDFDTSLPSCLALFGPIDDGQPTNNPQPHREAARPHRVVHTMGEVITKATSSMILTSMQAAARQDSKGPRTLLEKISRGPSKGAAGAAASSKWWTQNAVQKGPRMLSRSAGGG